MQTTGFKKASNVSSCTGKSPRQLFAWVALSLLTSVGCADGLHVLGRSTSPDSGGPAEPAKTDPSTAGDLQRLLLPEGLEIRNFDDFALVGLDLAVATNRPTHVIVKLPAVLDTYELDSVEFSAGKAVVVDADVADISPCNTSTMTYPCDLLLALTSTASGTDLTATLRLNISRAGENRYAEAEVEFDSKPLLGQPNFHSVLEREFGFSAPIDSCFAAGQAFILDKENSRVSVFEMDAIVGSSLMARPRFVLGQPHRAGKGVNNGGVSASSLNRPMGIACSATYLAIADTFNHRVLIWEGVPTSPRPADIVLGQADFVSNSANRGTASSPTALTLYSPSDLTFAGNKFIVSDMSNNRILIWNTVPTASNTAPDVVIGQSDFISRTTGTTATTLKVPNGISFADGVLAVADQGNKRVLIYDPLPSTDGASAARVIGQADAVSSTSGTTADTFALPVSVHLNNGAVVVSDYTNNRLMIWNDIPLADGALADRVLGQTDFISTTNGATEPNASSLSLPYRVAAFDGKYIVADLGNSRLMAFDTQASNGANALTAWGQPDFSSNRDGGVSTSAHTLAGPSGLAVIGDSLLIADTDNHRIVQSRVSDDGLSLVTSIIGQPDSVSAEANQGATPTASSLDSPAGMTAAAGSLFVADRMNNRVLTYPTTGGVAASASIVIGQNDMTSNQYNQCACATPGAGTLYRPAGVASDGIMLAIADTGNNRVLIYSTIPASSGATADFVLGQSSMTVSTANSGGLSSSSLSAPLEPYVSNDKLFVPDSGNHRVLVWDLPIIANNQPADMVLGQPDFTTNSAGNSLSSFFSPLSVSVQDGTLYISDTNHRVLVYGSIPTTDGASAESSVGTSDGKGFASYNTFLAPTAIRTWQGMPVVADRGNSRVIGLKDP